MYQVSSEELAYNAGRKNFDAMQCPYRSKTMREAWLRGADRGRAQEAFDALLLRLRIVRELREMNQLMEEIQATLQESRAVPSR